MRLAPAERFLLRPLIFLLLGWGLLGCKDPSSTFVFPTDAAADGAPSDGSGGAAGTADAASDAGAGQ